MFILPLYEERIIYEENLFVVTEYYTVYCAAGLQCICLTHCRHAVKFFRQGTRVENAIICGHDELNVALGWSGHVVLIYG